MCPEDIRQSLVGVLEQGVARPVTLNLPNSAAGARFPQLCLRKLYVICSRGGGSESIDGCLEDVSLCCSTYNSKLASCLRCMSEKLASESNYLSMSDVG